MRSTGCTLTKQAMGPVRRRTSTKHLSMMLVVRSLRHRYLGKEHADSHEMDRAAPGAAARRGTGELFARGHSSGAHVRFCPGWQKHKAQHPAG